MIISANKILYSKTNFRSKENLKSSPENLKSAANYQLPSYELSMHKFLNQGNISFGKKGDYGFSILNKYLRDIAKKPCLSPEMQDAVFRKYRQTKSSKLEKKLVESNLRLVITIIKKMGFGFDHPDFLDHLQNGHIGLMKAVQKYNPNNQIQTKFSTFAKRAIVHHILADSSKYANIVMQGVEAKKHYKLIQHYENITLKKEGRLLSAEELAEKMEVSPQRIEDLRDYASQRDVAIVHNKTVVNQNEIIIDNLAGDILNPEETLKEKERQFLVQQGIKKIFGIENLEFQLKELKKNLETFTGSDNQRKKLIYNIGGLTKRIATAKYNREIFDFQLQGLTYEKIAEQKSVSKQAVEQSQRRFCEEKHTIAARVLKSLE